LTLEIAPGVDPVTACKLLRGSFASLLLDGTGEEPGWNVGPLLAVDPRHRCYAAHEIATGLAELERIVARRRATGGRAETGVAALLGYELFNPRAGTRPAAAPLVTLEVDRSLRFLGDDRALYSSVDDEGPEAVIERLGREPERSVPISAVRAPDTSLPRDCYLKAVDRVQDHIGCGDIYQANLCQRFEVACAGDPLAGYEKMARATPAPRSAFLETPELALASLSPEIFLTGDPRGRVATYPIKGTRARGATAEADRQAAQALLDSEKDRAELLMIVDLERNDLSRVCRAGSVVVPELVELHSYPAVHHLVARVEGELREGVGLAEMLRATFPGGSISGAPKIRAMEILRELEPAARDTFTGSLIWFGDDGSLDSSILIRSWLFAGSRGYLGAGGGIVADSEPEAEWRESNHKARALAQAVGFDPEEAS
jgi:para-aminobenzoate synthetase component 1